MQCARQRCVCRVVPHEFVSRRAHFAVAKTFWMCVTLRCVGCYVLAFAGAVHRAWLASRREHSRCSISLLAVTRSSLTQPLLVIMYVAHRSSSLFGVGAARRFKASVSTTWNRSTPRQAGTRSRAHHARDMATDNCACAGSKRGRKPVREGVARSGWPVFGAPRPPADARLCRRAEGALWWRCRPSARAPAAAWSTARP